MVTCVLTWLASDVIIDNVAMCLLGCAVIGVMYLGCMTLKVTTVCRRPALSVPEKYCVRMFLMQH